MLPNYPINFPNNKSLDYKFCPNKTAGNYRAANRGLLIINSRNLQRFKSQLLFTNKISSEAEMLIDQ